MAQTAGPQMIVYLHCGSILCLLCGRNALVASFFTAMNHVGLNVHNTLYHSNQQRKETQPEETFTCKICEYKAGSSTGLDAHVMFSHS